MTRSTSGRWLKRLRARHEALDLLAVADAGVGAEVRCDQRRRSRPEAGGGGDRSARRLPTRSSPTCRWRNCHARQQARRFLLQRSRRVEAAANCRVDRPAVDQRGPPNPLSKVAAIAGFASVTAAPSFLPQRSLADDASGGRRVSPSCGLALSRQVDSFGPTPMKLSGRFGAGKWIRPSRPWREAFLMQ